MLLSVGLFPPKITIKIGFCYKRVPQKWGSLEMRPDIQQRITEQKNFSIFSPRLFFPRVIVTLPWTSDTVLLSATCCNTTATYCNTLRHTTTHCIAPAQYTHLDYLSHDSPPISSVCCSVLQYVVVCCSVMQCVAERCSVLQCVAVCCSVLQCVLQCVAVCCSELQCVAVRCSIVQYSCAPPLLFLSIASPHSLPTQALCPTHTHTHSPKRTLTHA